jgi:hypothetical protein
VCRHLKVATLPIALVRRRVTHQIRDRALLDHACMIQVLSISDADQMRYLKRVGDSFCTWVTGGWGGAIGDWLPCEPECLQRTD